MNDTKPTRARFVVLGYLCALMFVLYLDRVCISQAVDPIQQDLGLSNTEMSFVLMAFTLAYGLFEVPVGHWGDRIGPRAVLTRIAICWSFFTALTASATGFVSLLVIRFLFGIGEAGALPNSARIVSRWFPKPEQGRISGLLQTFMLLGGTAAPVVAAYLIEDVGWRKSFIIFGSVGLVWSAAFWVWFRDNPGQHSAVNAAELAHIGTGTAGETHHEPIPWRAALNNRSIWILGVIMMCSAFNTYVYYSWFPKYLLRARGLSQQEAGWLSSVVLAGAAVGTLSGGFVADYINRRANRDRARRIFGGVCYLLSAISLWVAMQFDSAWMTALFTSLSLVSLALTLSTWWACVFEVSGKHLGAMFGLVNGMGVFGAMGSQFFFGAFADFRKSQGYLGREQWDPAFMVVVGVLVVAALCWMQYTSHPVQPDEQVDHATDQS